MGRVMTCSTLVTSNSILVISIAEEVAICGKGILPDTKSQGNGKENGKWPQTRHGRRMAQKKGKHEPPEWDLGQFGAIFSMSAAIFRAFQPFSVSFSWDSRVGPVCHSVNGYSDRTISRTSLSHAVKRADFVMMHEPTH